MLDEILGECGDVFYGDISFAIEVMGVSDINIVAYPDIVVAGVLRLGLPT